MVQKTVELDHGAVVESFVHGWVLFHFGFPRWKIQGSSTSRRTVRLLLYSKAWSLRWRLHVMIWARIWRGGGRTVAVRINGTINGTRIVQVYRQIVTSTVIPTVKITTSSSKMKTQPLIEQPLSDKRWVIQKWFAYRGQWGPQIYRQSNMHGMLWIEKRLLLTSSNESKGIGNRLMLEGGQLKQSFLNVLCDSMPRRLRPCIQPRGGHARY